jgi:hypothetical protein
MPRQAESQVRGPGTGGTTTEHGAVAAAAGPSHESESLATSTVLFKVQLRVAALAAGAKPQRRQGTDRGRLGRPAGGSVTVLRLVVRPLRGGFEARLRLTGTEAQAH